MVGATHKYICAGCKFMHLGLPDNNECVKCRCTILNDHGIPKEDESLPSDALCLSCREKIKNINAIVQLGGVSFRCSSCGSMGAFAADDARAVSFKKEAPAGKSILFDESSCPECETIKQSINNQDEKNRSQSVGQ